MRFYFNVFFILLFFTSTAQIPSYISSNGLVAYYPFNGNANDLSGNNNNPTYNNATLTSDRQGNLSSAYHFNGLNSYMRIPSSASLNTGAQLSLFLWVRPTGFYSGPCHGNSVLEKGSANYGPGSYFVNFNESHLGTNCGGVLDTIHQNFIGADAIQSPNGYTPFIQKNTWYNVAITYDGQFAKIYVNSQLVLSSPQATTLFSNAHDLFLGKLDDLTFPYWFNGDIDDLMIYNRALSQQEITNYYNGPIPTYLPSNGLMAYYPFNGNPNDYSGNNNNPTVNTASLTSNRFGAANSAYHFDGSSSYMRISNSTTLNTTNKLTIHTWLKPNGFYAGTCHGNSVLMKGDQDYLTGTYFLRFDDSHLGTNCSGPVNTTQQNYYGPGIVQSASGYSPYVSVGKWTNVVLTYDGALVKIYINSQLVSSSSQSITSFTNAYDLFIGRLNSSTYPYWFNGDIDEIALYNRDLSQQEINNLYTGNCSIAASITTNGLTCGSAAVQLSATTQGLNQTIDWYSTQTGGVALSGGVGVLSYTTPILTTTTTYYAQSRDTLTGCVSSTRTPAVATVYSSLVPSAPISIYGITDICSTIGTSTTSPAVTYYVRKVTNAYSYNWTVPNGATIISGQGDTAVKIKFNNSFVSGTISVVALNACGTSSSARTLAVYKRIASTPAAIQKQFTPSSIAAVTNVCGLSSEIYRIKKVTYATSYNWSLKIGTKATITHINALGVNDTAVIVTFLSGFSIDTLNVASVTPCSVSTPKTLNLNAVLAPPAVTSLTASGNNFSPCIGDIVSYSATASVPTTSQSNIAVFRWTRPSFTAILSATSDSSTISLKYNAGFVGGSISVKGQSACGIAGTAKSATLQYLPPTPTSITSSTGTYNACIGNQITYTVFVPAPTSSQRVASVYRWTKPNYTTILSAALDSSSIVLKFNSGYIGGSLSVKGQTLCGVQGTSKTQALTHTSCPTGTKNNPYVLNKSISNTDKNSVGFIIYPNPSNSVFNIHENSNDISQVEITIFDLQGRLIEKNVYENSANIKLGQNLKSGVYMAEIKKGESLHSFRLVKY